MYEIIYRQETDGGAEILHVLKGSINSEAFPQRDGLKKTSCGDRAQLESELSSLDSNWQSKIDVFYVNKND